jgi:hypothetical protein
MEHVFFLRQRNQSNTSGQWLSLKSLYSVLMLQAMPSIQLQGGITSGIFGASRARS